METTSYEGMSNYYRGLLISRFATLEKSLDYYLASQFTSRDNIADLTNIIIDRLTFENKKTALKAILDKKSSANGFVRTNTKSFPSGKFIEELRSLQFQRNCFAHYHLSTNIDEPSSIISLIEFRDSKSILHYTKTKYYNILKRMDEAISKIIKDDMIPS
jgi:hypothetical protein